MACRRDPELNPSRDVTLIKLFRINDKNSTLNTLYLGVSDRPQN